MGRIEQTPLDGESDFLSRPKTVTRNPTIPQTSYKCCKTRKGRGRMRKPRLGKNDIPGKRKAGAVCPGPHDAAT